ncbi:hypothetical protein NDU88_004760 [Pleurodeles waltl]|uniref:Uncharacterized protein n=1 Tax=Pleurodeles waltl TaxID=8319 RepID=A0AAV7MW22_PLEWA|nr:hypothetical protein NDU88_004760 [Pleurodeles waltl]
MQHTRAGTIVQIVGRELTQWCLAPCKEQYTRAQLLALNTPLGPMVCSLVTLCPQIPTESDRRHGCRSVRCRKIKMKKSCQTAAKASKTGKQGWKQLPKKPHEDFASPSSPNLK